MLKNRISIYLEPNEYEAVKELAQREYRNIRKQAAMLIKSELQRLSLLDTENIGTVKHGQ
jgi:hypothetical protein